MPVTKTLPAGRQKTRVRRLSVSAAFPADESRPLKLIEEARDGLLGHETFLGQRRWFRSLGTPEHRVKDQELRV